MKKPALLIYAAPELRAEVKLAAREEGRSVSDTARRVLLSWATQRVIERGAVVNDAGAVR